MTTDHDSDYRLLFSHPAMLRHPLRDWGPGDWSPEAAFSTLEWVNGSYVAESQKQDLMAQPPKTSMSVATGGPVAGDALKLGKHYGSCAQQARPVLGRDAQVQAVFGPKMSSRLRASNT